MPNSRNYCFHGSGHIIRKGGQELGLHRPWNMFPQTQSNYPHHAKTSFVSKGFCTNTDDYISPEWDGADFQVLHELFLLLRSQDHLRSLSLLGTSGLWRKNSPSNKKILFEEENPSSSKKKMLLNKMASLVFLVLGSLAQRVKIPDLPSCEGLILFSNGYIILCKSLICFRFSRGLQKPTHYFGLSLLKEKDLKIWKKWTFFH